MALRHVGIGERRGSFGALGHHSSPARVVPMYRAGDDAVSGLREWAEEHWVGVGLAVSIAGALTISLILAVAFNVITTRLEGLHRDAVHAAPPVSNARSRVSNNPESGAI